MWKSELKYYFLVFDGENTTEFYNLNNDTLMTNNLINELTKNQQFTKVKAEELLKGIIQQYDNRLINNHLSAEKN